MNLLGNGNIGSGKKNDEFVPRVTGDRANRQPWIWGITPELLRNLQTILRITQLGLKLLMNVKAGKGNSEII